MQDKQSARYNRPPDDGLSITALALAHGVKLPARIIFCIAENLCRHETQLLHYQRESRLMMFAVCRFTLMLQYILRCWHPAKPNTDLKRGPTSRSLLPSFKRTPLRGGPSCD